MVKKMVEEYLNKIDKELYGLNASEKANILIELKGHIMDKANELAAAEGKKQPTAEIYQSVIQKLGEPEKIGKEYLDISTKEQTIGKLSLREGDGEQKLICLASIIIIAIGIFLTLLQNKWDNYTTRPYVPLSFGVIVLGVIIGAYALWIYPARNKVQIEGKHKMIYLIGILLTIIGSFLTLYRTPSSPGVHGTFPFIPWSFVVILLGILVIAYVRWIYISKN